VFSILILKLTIFYNILVSITKKELYELLLQADTLSVANENCRSSSVEKTLSIIELITSGGWRQEL
jgi:hypothetical protein